MQGFVFHNPTKIVFGTGSSSQLSAHVTALGHKALLVYGQQSIKKSGLYDKIVSQLQETGMTFVEHGGVKSNPSLTHTREGIAKARAEKVDFVIAVGGGSVIDEAKSIAAGAVAEDDVWRFYLGEAKIEKALPLATVLTLPATGSEMNGNAVITNDETNDKLGLASPHFYPRVSILDPSLTVTVPPRYTAASAVDIVSHLTESYFTNDGGWTPLQEYYVEGLVKTVMAATRRILQNPEDLEARATLMWSATLGWNGLNVAGVGAFSMPCHALEHPISALYDIAHGAGLAIVTPAWLTAKAEEKATKIARFAREIFAVQEEDDRRATLAGIAALKDWYREIGAPLSFGEAGITEPDIEELTRLTVKGAAIRKTPGLLEDFVRAVFSACR